MAIYGIDLGDDFSQICWYNLKTGQPESVNFGDGDGTYRVPTALLWNGRGFLAGLTASQGQNLGGVYIDGLLRKAVLNQPVHVDRQVFMPVELMQAYLGHIIQSAAEASGEAGLPEAVCVTVEDYSVALLRIIEKSLIKLGIKKDRISFSCHDEAFVFYAINQKEELWRNDNVLFDYGKQGMVFRRMATINDKGKRLVMTETNDYTKRLPYSTMMDEISQPLLDIAKEELEKRPVTAVYLTGEGFEGDFGNDRFINYICSRRRVFAGQNLYSKGACYQAVMEHLRDSDQFIIACAQRVTSAVDLKICDRGRDRLLRLVTPGVNWYNAGCSYDFIVDDCNELEFFVTPLKGRQGGVKLPLTGIPAREGKASRIRLDVEFTSDSLCHIIVKDMGFGEFVKSSGKVIQEDLRL